METTIRRYGRRDGSSYRTNTRSLLGPLQSPLDVLVSPLRGRTTVVLGERPVESRIGCVAGASRNLLGRVRRTQQQITRQFHPELGQVGHRWLTKKTCESLGEGGSRQVGALRHLGTRPRSRRVGVDGVQHAA